MLGHFLAHTQGFTLYGVLFDFACNIRFDLFKHPSVLIARLFIGALSILFLSGQYRCIGCKIRKNTATLKNQSRTKREYQKSLNKGITTIQTSFKQNSPRLLLTSVNLFYGLILCGVCFNVCAPIVFFVCDPALFWRSTWLNIGVIVLDFWAPTPNKFKYF